MISAANAQYAPQKGDFATEIGFAPFHSKGNDGKTFKLNEGMFKVRYFLTDKDALRLKLGVGIDNSSNTKTENSTVPENIANQPIWNSITEYNDKLTKFSFAIGYERHLFVSGRFDVYAGAEFGYQMTSASGDKSVNKFTTQYDEDKNIASTTAQIDNYEYTDKQAEGKEVSSHSFVGGVFAGLDFYVYKGLYLGAELGISFKSGKTPNYYESYNTSEVTKNKSGVETYSKYVTYSGDTGNRVETKYDGQKTTTTTTQTQISSNEKTTTKLEFYVEPVIRLGWRF